MTNVCENRATYVLNVRAVTGAHTFNLFLRPENGNVPAFLPGQTVTAYADGFEPADFLITSAPDAEELRLSVLHRPDKHGMAAHLAAMQAGDKIELSAPHGEFVLDPGETPLVFFCEGAGSAAAYALLAAMAVKEPMRDVSVLCQERNNSLFPMEADLRRVVNELPNAGLGVYFTEPLDTEKLGREFNCVGQLEAVNVKGLCRHPEADFYVAGHKRFVDAVSAVLATVQPIASRTHKLVI